MVPGENAPGKEMKGTWKQFMIVELMQISNSTQTKSWDNLLRLVL